MGIFNKLHRQNLTSRPSPKFPEKTWLTKTRFNDSLHNNNRRQIPSNNSHHSRTPLLQNLKTYLIQLKQLVHSRLERSLDRDVATLVVV